MRFLVGASAVAVAGVACAEVMDRPVGIKVGQRMTIKPYVAAGIGYDSNVDGRRDGSDDMFWTVNPGFGLDYLAENWALIFNAWYQYNGYAKNASNNQNSYHTFGEDGSFRWTNSRPGEKGWSLLLAERFTKMNDAQDMGSEGGQAYNRDRYEAKLAAAVQRRFGERWHADLNAGYYWLDYDNNNNSRGGGGLYGWERWSVGGEWGYAASHWTDILVAGSYMEYDSDNVRNVNYTHQQGYGQSSGSRSWTVQAGLGSYATERITYRVLGGWSRYLYKQGGSRSDGFTYSVGGNWKISETWSTMLLGTSFYQPTEREYGSSQRVDSLSWGLAHLMVRGKLSGNFDIAYRRETPENKGVEGYDYDLDILTTRFGLNYTINRYLAVYGNIEYRMSLGSGSSERGDEYTYNRFRATLGLRFTY